MEAFTKPLATQRAGIVGKILAKLSPDDRALAMAALAADKDEWPHTAIVENFEILGFAVSETSVRTYRKRLA